MKLAGSIALFHYWNRLRDGRSAPKRTEIEPADIKKLLADTFILEKDTRGEAVFRLAGTRLCAAYGRELKGFSFPSLWRPKDQQLISRLLDSVFHKHSVALIAYEAISRTGRSVPFELLALPLEGGPESLRCLGVAAPAHRPFWLGADPIGDAVIDALRTVDPNAKKAAPPERPAIGAPELAPIELDAASTLAGYGRARRIRHLLVLDGGRDEE
ncbi:PAS domain-containing protein [Aquamicrobium terrae]|uniref:PAS domain-containing protein n=1 Tax=Aquamicrobium terrae TaxID=1324945 RepID=A0ABV2MXL2_9HYPH